MFLFVPVFIVSCIFVVISEVLIFIVVAFSLSTAAILTLAAWYFFIISDLLFLVSCCGSFMSRPELILSGLCWKSLLGIFFSIARVLCVSTLPLRLRPRAENRPIDVELCLGGGLLDSSAAFVELVSGVS